MASQRRCPHESSVCSQDDCYAVGQATLRRTPIRRKRATPRRKAATCTVRGCKRRPSDVGLCRTHAEQQADRLFSLQVRSGGRCERCGATESLQCSHFISRRYTGVRFNRLNAECLCYRCHKYLTHHPLEATARFEELVGQSVAEELRRLALSFKGPPDWGIILSTLAKGDDSP